MKCRDMDNRTEGLDVMQIAVISRNGSIGVEIGLAFVWGDPLRYAADGGAVRNVREGQPSLRFPCRISETRLSTRCPDLRRTEGTEVEHHVPKTVMVPGQDAVDSWKIAGGHFQSHVLM